MTFVLHYADHQHMEPLTGIAIMTGAGMEAISRPSRLSDSGTSLAMHQHYFLVSEGRRVSRASIVALREHLESQCEKSSPPGVLPHCNPGE